MQPLRSIAITATSSLLWVAPHLCFALVLSSLRDFRFGLFPYHQNSRFSHVSHKRLNQSHAASTPDVAQAAIQASLELCS